MGTGTCPDPHVRSALRPRSPIPGSISKSTRGWRERRIAFPMAETGFQGSRVNRIAATCRTLPRF